MCLTAPARVVSTDGDVATVELDGRLRRASLAVLPDARPGDWVIVGAGTVLRRLDPVDAEDVRERIALARAATALRGGPATDPATTPATAHPTTTQRPGDPR